MTRLPTAARSYWRAKLALQALGAVVLVMAATDGADLPRGLIVLALVVAALGAVLAVPEVRWRRWAFAVGDEEIELRHGVVVVRRTLLPIRRVQHVDTEQGPLQSQFGLATVTFHTAAGGVAIPALRAPDADALRRRVAELARTLDDV